MATKKKSAQAQKKPAKRPVVKQPAPEQKAGLSVEMWPIERPIPYARNARKANPRAIDTLAASLKEYGWRQPIVVDGEGVIIAGHHRLLAAQKLGLESVPVHVANDLTEAQVKAYRLADNRSHDNTSWDIDLLEVEMSDLRSLEVSLELTGFDQGEIDKLFASQKEPEEKQSPDEFPEYDEAIETQYECPKCAYRWSGKPRPDAAE